MKKTIKNISLMTTYNDHIELEWESFYGIDVPIHLGDDVTIEYTKKKKKNIVTNITVSPSQEKQQRIEKQKKVQQLKEKTIDEIIASEESYQDTGLQKKELWDFLIEKFYQWNHHNEIKDHRIFIEAIVNVLTPEQKQQLFTDPKILALNQKAQKVKQVLQKF